MRRNSGGRCTLQVARERRLSAYPDEFGMEQDICDVTLWLSSKFRQPSLLLWIDRHYFYHGPEIARVTVMLASGRSEPLTQAARNAFLALNYTIKNTGADTAYGFPLCDGHHSRHEALLAYARIEAALRKQR